MLGTFVLSAGYFDAYYTKAQKSRRLIKKELENIFSKYDFVAMPCTTGQPWKIGAMDKDPVAVYLSDVFTVLANLCGVPAINVPYKSAIKGNNYYGFQVLAPYMKEKNLLSFINKSFFMA
jgi:aspartyl-tRNA(Asn)/glutamyl-tRNA(Gln) amidotransferase subunit A